MGTNSGAIYTYLLEMQDLNGQTDSFYFVEQIKINADFESSRKDISRPVVSLHYSSLLEVLFVSHYNGNTEDSKSKRINSSLDKEALSASGRATRYVTHVNFYLIFFYRAQKKDSTTFPDIYFGKPHVQSNGTVSIENPSIIEIKKTLSSSVRFTI